ncbi:MAG: 3-deoxy-7-phosphoheptulonate synthase [Lachnospiraceae bacterium]
MNITYERLMPDPEVIREMYPVTPEITANKTKRDQELKDILAGKENKFILVIGPCSADNEDSVLDYCIRLWKVAGEVKDKIFIIPRVYTNKPRTRGTGYKGMLHQPDPEGKADMLNGLVAIRKMHLDVCKQTGFTTADEMLYPENHSFLDDVLSYVAVGARSVENQQHRMVASALDVPCGMKNPTSGDFSVMLNAIVAAQAPQTFIYRNYEVHSTGNPYAHAILRGAISKHGAAVPNYHFEDLMRLYEMYQHVDVKNRAVIVDCNHSNSGKQYMQQIRIAKEVLHSMRQSKELSIMVKGLMIESYIEPGCQKIGEGVYGKSITDPCLGWDDTEKLIKEIADTL